MNTSDWMVPSFYAETRPDGDTTWRGAIYAMHPGLGPELVLQCAHAHHSMRRAVLCAERELIWARRVVAIAAEGRPS